MIDTARQDREVVQGIIKGGKEEERNTEGGRKAGKKEKVRDGIEIRGRGEEGHARE